MRYTQRQRKVLLKVHRLMKKQKIWVTLSLAMAILTTILLSAALPRLELHPGSLFEATTIAELKALLAQFRFYRGTFLVFFAMLLILVFAWYLYAGRKAPSPPPTPRKKKSSLITLLQIIFWAIAILIIRRQLVEGQLQLNLSNLLDSPSMPEAVQPTPINPNVPDWFAFIFGLALFLVIMALAWRAWQRRKRPARGTLELLYDEAFNARQALQAGENLRNVILRCYYEMGQAVDRQRGVRRKEDMTPREFERRLLEIGLPAGPVAQLTRLFEAVRYGAKQPGEQAERQAVECLEAIVQASGRSV
jgi:hypothetical protein